ncbi:MFS transporter [Rhodococcus sp. IEGM 1307]|uniref:MFS transporter n=1 Tax=Rhodococcus sp. IEGM 1307 TaxID=3047091 RepID=UPI0024B6D1C7|nr:MFS transporter [Rhodococcus sp. IEGM 1307]MDI9979607.1 MFS transporter [Rhodococcus sp. IEGM 1307]
MDDKTEHIPTATSATGRRAALTGGLGTVIEYYEFSLYGLLAVFLAPLFFPSDDPAVSTVAALGALGVSNLARPLGGILIGRYADRHGRRTMLLLTILVMGLASAAIGMLPGYATVGIAAPVLLVLIRFVQGLSAAGEAMGATAYAVESSPSARRTFFSSFIGSGGSWGYVLSAVVTGALSLVVSPDNMASWGWRIPFLLCLPLALLCLWLRRSMDDSPEFVREKVNAQLSPRPFRDVVLRYPKSVIRVIGIQIGLSAPGYIGLIYLTVFLISERGFPKNQVYWVTAIAIALEALTIPLYGILADRIGGRRLLLVSTVAYIVLAYPLILGLARTDSIMVVAILYTVFMQIAGAQTAPAWAIFADLFPTNVRTSGMALGYNVGVTVAGGFGPFIAAQLVLLTGSQLAPAYWVIAGSVIGLAAILSLPRPHSADQPSRA